MKQIKTQKIIKDKKFLELILKTNNIDYQYIAFIDADGKQDYAYMIYDFNNGRHFYQEDCCGGFIEYNKDKSYTKEEIEYGKQYMGFYELYNDGRLFELDVFPTFRDFIKFPITNVKFVNEESVLRDMVEKRYASLYNGFII